MGKKQRGQGHGKSKNGNKSIFKGKGDFNQKRNGKTEYQNGRNNRRDSDRSQSRNNGRKDFNKPQRGGRNSQEKFDRSQSRNRGNNRKDFNKYESKGKNNQRQFDRSQSKGKSKERSQSKGEFNIDKKSHRQNNGKKSTVGGEYAHMVGQSLFKIIPEGEYENNGNDLNEQNNQQQYEEVQIDENQVPQYSQQEEMSDEEQQVGEGSNDDEDEDEFDDGGYEQQGKEGEQDEQEFEYEEQGDEDEQNLQQEGEGEGEEIEQGQQQNEGDVEGIDEQQESDQNVDISVIGLKIQETIQVLMNVGRLGQGRSRKYFINKLKAYVHRYYGYNFELIDHFLNFFNPAEMVQFFEANETHRPLTIRTNTLKIRRKQLAQFLIQRGVNLDPLAEWSKVGIKIYDTKVPIGATPQYLAGYYMLQSGSSFLPVLALDPQMNEKILDMASAPGGKTSYIAQIMKNTGSVFANDLKKDRLKALQFNMYRLGISNTVVTCRDGRKYPEIFPNTFDRVLLDAPCTGLGIISKDHSIKANRVLLDIYKNSHVQKQLLLAAIDCTKVGGVIVYSTCSVSPLENEEVINYALKKRYVKIVDIDDLVEVGDSGLTKFVDKRYHVDLRKTKRIYPHVHNMDGFYLGKLVKIGNGKKESNKKGQEKGQEQEIME